MAPLAAYTNFFTQGTKLAALTKYIPETVPLATKDNEINCIVEKFPIPEQVSYLTGRSSTNGWIFYLECPRHSVAEVLF